MTEMIKSYLDKINVGAEQSYKNLTMFPLLSNISIPWSYLTKNASLSNDLIEKEAVDKHRSTTKRKVLNKSKEMDLILGGENKAGVNQDRGVNDTLLIQRKETVLIPEKCTVQNQSSSNSNRNYSNERCTGSWVYMEQFARVDGQIGAIFLINGKIAGMVYFASPETFEKSFIKIVECYAKKAVDKFSPKMVLKSSKPEVINFLQTPYNYRIETQPTARM